MNDKNGKPITPGTTLKRVIEGRGAHVGYEYIVRLYDFNGDGEEALVADGGFIKEAIDAERAKEFEVIE